MSRDFILVFSGGMVSLVTTLVVLFIADYFYRHERERETQAARQPRSPAVPPPSAPLTPAAALAVQTPVATPSVTEQVAVPSIEDRVPASSLADAPNPAAAIAQSIAPGVEKPTPVQTVEKSEAPPPFPPPPETITRDESGMRELNGEQP